MLRLPEPLPPGCIPPEVTEILRPLETVGLSRSNGSRIVGGKAAQLGRLTRDGYPVPHGWVLDESHFVSFVERELPRGYDIGSLIKIATSREGIDRAARARDRIVDGALPGDVTDALARLWEGIEPHAPWGLSVRSSATCEDDADTSLAGLATSILGVRGPAELERAVRQVWASLYLPRTLAYLARRGVRQVTMPVIVQVMAQAAAAGVLFSSPPPGLEGERWGSGERMISATFGLGAPVVEGATCVDMFRVGLRGDLVDAVVAVKPAQLVVTERGVEEVSVADEQRDRPALDPEALRALAELTNRLETTGAGPFDIEFAVERDQDSLPRILVLQARPLTGGTYPEGGDADTVWSRANVGEALPGAATPLTWSIAKSFSDRGFRDAFAALGCRVSRSAVLVANVYGRFYLNLSAFMRISAQVPGLTPRALLGASGGANESQIRRLEQQVEDVNKRGFFLRAPLVAPNLLRRYGGLPADVEAFEERAQRARRSLLDLDLALLPDDALATTLRSARSLLDDTGSLMLTCASASLAAHLAVTGAIELTRRRPSVRGPRHDDRKPTIAPVDRVVQTLLGGIEDLDSAGPGVALLEVAHQAQQEPAVMEVLTAERPPRSLTALPQGPTRRALDRFLDRYGDRAVREAELSVPRWREDQASLLTMLASAARQPDTDPYQALARARALSDRELAVLETQLTRVEQAVVRSLVSKAQQLTSLRERMRAWVTRVLGMIRYVALDIDRRLRRIDPQLPAGSVFFCTYDELERALASGRAEIGHVVRLRRAEHLRDAARPDPPTTFVGRPPPVALPPAAGPRWQGLAASGGVVEGVARVLQPGEAGLDKLALEPGEILVSRTTDIGLSPLFLVAAAVVTELGGPLSHAAIVAREYGVPAVVSVAGATMAIRNGDRLRVDGDRGVVERLARPGEDPS